MKLKITPELFILQEFIVENKNEDVKKKVNFNLNENLNGCEYVENNYLLNDYKLDNKEKIIKHETFKSDIRNITLIKNWTMFNFGLSIKGGHEYNLPLIISAIQPNSIASKCKSIFIGDLILEINNLSVYPLILTHEKSIKLIKKSGNKLQLSLKHLSLFNNIVSYSWKKFLNDCLCNQCSNNSNTTCINRKILDRSYLFKESNKIGSQIFNDEGFSASSIDALSNYQNSNCSSSDNSQFGLKDNVKKKSNLRINKKYKFIENKSGNEKDVGYQKDFTKTENKKKFFDVVSVKLINCFFTKYIGFTDNIGKNRIEVIWLNQENSLNSVVINFTDRELAQKFPIQINSYVNKLNESFLSNFNKKFYFNSKIFYMGWISLAFKNQNDALFQFTEIKWYPKYMIMKDSDLIFYNRPPSFLVNDLLYNDDVILEFSKLNNLVNLNEKLNCELHLEKNTSSFNLNESLNSPDLTSKSDEESSIKKDKKSSTAGIFEKDENINKEDLEESLTNDFFKMNFKSKETSNKPFRIKIFKSILRQLNPEEQLDRRKNCLIAITSNSYSSAFENFLIKSKIPASTSTLNYHHNQNKTIISNINGINSNKMDYSDYQLNDNINLYSNNIYLSVEYPDNLQKIIKSWSDATFYSVKNLYFKSFKVISEGNFCKLVLHWKKGFILYKYHPQASLISYVGWNYDFAQFKNSSDDGKNRLWLSFETIIKNNNLEQNQNRYGSINSVDSYKNLFYNRNNRSLSEDRPTNMKKYIQTKELFCENLSDLLYYIHSFLFAKFISIDKKINSSIFETSL